MSPALLHFSTRWRTQAWSSSSSGSLSNQAEWHHTLPPRKSGIARPATTPPALVVTVADVRMNRIACSCCSFGDRVRPWIAGWPPNTTASPISPKRMSTTSESKSAYSMPPYHPICTSQRQKLLMVEQRTNQGAAGITCPTGREPARINTRQGAPASTSHPSRRSRSSGPHRPINWNERAERKTEAGTLRRIIRISDSRLGAGRRRRTRRRCLRCRAAS